MLRNSIAKVLFNKQTSKLNNEEIDICNKFIDDFNKVMDWEK